MDMLDTLSITTLEHDMNATQIATYRTRRAAQFARVTFQPTRVVLPDGITSTRTFDDPTIADEAHWAMVDRARGERASIDGLDGYDA